MSKIEEEKEQNRLMILCACIALPVCIFGYCFNDLGIKILPNDCLWYPILISLIISIFFIGIFGKELNEKTPLVLKKYENEIKIHDVSDDLVKICENTVYKEKNTVYFADTFWRIFNKFYFFCSVFLHSLG